MQVHENISLDDIRAPIQPDLKALNQIILTELTSQIPLIEQIVLHILKSGGKRLRPLVLILVAKALGYNGDNEHHEVAAILEFIHTATLLHDDVIDESNLRRGQKTANAVWGNEASVLAGDFLYSRAFQLLARRSNLPVMKVFANTTNAIAEGEILQLMNRNRTDVSEATYLQVIIAKTAKLFESAALIGAMISTTDQNKQQAMADFGLQLGLAFQIIDDVLDYMADPEVMGKNVGDDLAEGKATLPLIHAAKHGTKEQQQLIFQSIENGGIENFDAIAAAIAETNACEYCLQKARQAISKAQQSLELIDHSPYKTALESLLKFVVSRTY